MAIGEVGMDYFYVSDKDLRERQEEIFRGFLDLANEYKVPIVMHVRDCEKKAVNIIEDYLSSLEQKLLLITISEIKNSEKNNESWRFLYELFYNVMLLKTSSGLN